VDKEHDGRAAVHFDILIQVDAVDNRTAAAMRPILLPEGWSEGGYAFRENPGTACVGSDPACRRRACCPGGSGCIHQVPVSMSSLAAVRM